MATCCKPGRFLHSTCLASCQPVEQVANLFDQSRHVEIDLSGWQLVGNPKKLRTCSQLVGNPGWQPKLPTSFQLVRLVECGPYACISEESDRIVMRLSANEIGILATEYSRWRGEENKYLKNITPELTSN